MGKTLHLEFIGGDIKSCTGQRNDIHCNAIDARIVLEQNKFSKKKKNL